MTSLLSVLLVAGRTLVACGGHGGGERTTQRVKGLGLTPEVHDLVVWLGIVPFAGHYAG